jgi:hypothetical protein
MIGSWSARLATPGSRLTGGAAGRRIVATVAAP